MLKFICYPKCTTCQKARKWLDENNIEYEFRDIKILIFRPTAAKKVPAQTPGILWIHGGGYATGMAR